MSFAIRPTISKHVSIMGVENKNNLEGILDIFKNIKIPILDVSVTDLTSSIFGGDDKGIPSGTHTTPSLTRKQQCESQGGVYAKKTMRFQEWSEAKRKYIPKLVPVYKCLFGEEKVRWVRFQAALASYRERMESETQAWKNFWNAVGEWNKAQIVGVPEEEIKDILKKEVIPGIKTVYGDPYYYYYTVDAIGKKYSPYGKRTKPKVPAQYPEEPVEPEFIEAGLSIPKALLGLVVLGGVGYGGYELFRYLKKSRR